MKKSNVIIFVIFAVISVFLLWLWYTLGLDKVDAPLDLILSIIWWVVIVVAGVVIYRVEKVRQQRVRTLYVSDDLVFNSELGSKSYDNPVDLMTVAEEILNDIKYNFNKETIPNKDAFPVKFFIRTNKYKKDDTWEGEVVNAETGRSTEFEDKDGLFKLVNEMAMYNRGAVAQSASAAPVAPAETAPLSEPSTAQ